MKLTKEQAKMVIDYFSAQAAEDAPMVTTDWAEWDKHIWMTCFDLSLKLERIVNVKDWAALLNSQITLQSFDRDPAAYLFDRGEEDNEHTNNYYHEELRDVASMWIDSVYNTTKAA